MTLTFHLVTLNSFDEPVESTFTVSGDTLLTTVPQLLAGIGRVECMELTDVRY